MKFSNFKALFITVETLEIIKKVNKMHYPSLKVIMLYRGQRGRDGMVVWLITTYAMNAYIITDVVSSNPVQADIIDTTLCYKVCQWAVAGQWFSPCTLVSSTNKTERHDITEILMKVVLNTISHPPTYNVMLLQKCDNTTKNVQDGNYLVKFF